MPLNTLRPGLNFWFKPEWGFSAFTDAYTQGIIGLQVVWSIHLAQINRNLLEEKLFQSFLEDFQDLRSHNLPQ